MIESIRDIKGKVEKQKRDFISAAYLLTPRYYCVRFEPIGGWKINYTGC
jgi:hypothetical protein